MGANDGGSVYGLMENVKGTRWQHSRPTEVISLRFRYLNFLINVSHILRLLFAFEVGLYMVKMAFIVHS